MKKLSIIAAAAAMSGCAMLGSDDAVSSAPFGTTKYGEKATLYTLKGKGVNQLVKLIAAIVSIAVTLIMLIQSLISAIRFDIPGWVIIRWFLEDCAYTLLWISVILHSPFKKTA